MRILLFAFLLCSSAVAADAPIKYPIRNIPQESEKFFNIYKTVADYLLQKENAKHQTVTVKILQTIEPGFYRIKVGETNYVAKIPGKPKADDTTVEMRLVDTDEVYQYTTVLGAKATIKVVAVPPAPERITPAELIAALKSGKEFLIPIGTQVERCSACAGFGGNALSGKCRKCSGRGQWKVPQFYSIKW